MNIFLPLQIKIGNDVIVEYVIWVWFSGAENSRAEVRRKVIIVFVLIVVV